MKKWRRAAAAFLCICMLLSSGGCGAEAEMTNIDKSGAETGGESQSGQKSTGSENEEETNPPSDKNEDALVYVAEFQVLSDLKDVGREFAVNGDTLYFTSYSHGNSGQSSESGGRMNMRTRACETFELGMKEGEYITGMTADENGTITLLLTCYGEGGPERSNGEARYVLVQRDSAGEESIRQDITEDLTGQKQWKQDELSPYAIEADSQGNIYVMLQGFSTVILCYDAQGQFQWQAEADGYGEGIVRNRAGQVFYIGDNRSVGERNSAIYLLDPSAKGFGEIWEGLPEHSVSHACFDGETQILLACGSGLYRYDLSTRTYTEELSWINADIISHDIFYMTAMPDGQILVLTYGNEEEGKGKGTEVAFLSRVPASQAPQKTRLTLGTLALDSILEARVLSFNKKSETCRLYVKEYGAGDREAGLAELQADILGKNGPDLLDLQSLNVDILIARGVLADLYPLMDGDSQTPRTDFVASVLKTYERDGRLYGIAPCFRIFSLAGKTSVVGDGVGWTMAGVRTVLAERPDAKLLEPTPREEVMPVLLALGIQKYVNWTTGECSFDSQGFQELLEFAAMFPGLEEWKRDEEADEKLKEEQYLLTPLNNLSQIFWYWHRTACFGGEAVNAIGYPMADEKGTWLAPAFSFGILEQSSHRQEAWSFLSGLLSEEEQRSFYEFPIRESVLQEAYDEAMTSDGMYGYPPADKEEIAAVRRMIEEGQGAPAADTEICRFIEEEAAAYFAGQKTAEEVSDAIQSRVALYVGENR